MPACEYCKAQLATEGIYCDDCWLEVVFDTLEGDVIAAYQEGVIQTRSVASFSDRQQLRLLRPRRKDFIKSLGR